MNYTKNEIDKKNNKTRHAYSADDIMTNYISMFILTSSLHGVQSSVRNCPSAVVAAAVSLDVRQDEAGDLEEEIDEAEEEEELRRHPREIDLSGPA